jgi:hypothetical protein
MPTSKFIEDVFLRGRRIDPATDGRPDPRPTVRENVGILGDLSLDFDFTRPPSPPLILPGPPLSAVAPELVEHEAHPQLSDGVRSRSALPGPPLLRR